MTTTTLPSQNEAWGFHGEMARHEGAIAPEQPFAQAQAAIADALPWAAPYAIRAFLDSRHGRHFADDVNNALTEGHDLDGALVLAVARWMGWRICARTEREHGIPRGLPYLTGWITHFEITDETEAAQ